MAHRENQRSAQQNSRGKRGRKMDRAAGSAQEEEYGQKQKHIFQARMNGDNTG